jgi:uncharacterized protein (TIGR03437 family)
VDRGLRSSPSSLDGDTVTWCLNMRNSAVLLICATTCCFGQVITTVAGSDFVFPKTPLPALSAPLGANGLPFCACAVDASGNLFLSDVGNNRVFQISPSGILSVVAGNGLYGFSGDGGPAADAALANPGGVAVDGAGNVYVADTSNYVIRKVSRDGIITIFAGNGQNGDSGDNGPATAATFYLPQEVVVDAAGNVFVEDTYINVVRKISPDGKITTVAGNGESGYSGDNGPAVSAKLNFANSPADLALDGAGNLYIADAGNNRIRKVSPDGIITTIAGNGTSDYAGDNGPANAAALNFPTGVAVDGAVNIYIADFGNNVIRKVSAAGVITTIAGNGGSDYSGDGGPATAAAIQPMTVRLDVAGNLYIGQADGHLRKITLDGRIATIAGNGQFQFSGDGGPATRANLSLPTSVAVGNDGSLYVADASNSRIRKVSRTGLITTFAGNGLPGSKGDGGPATAASMVPFAVTVDTAGNVYFTDSFSNNLRKVSPAGVVTLVAGNGQSDYSGDNGPATAAALSFPTGVAVDGAGNIYIGDSGNNRIRKVSTDGIITTVAGNGKSDYAGDNGPATAAALHYPTGVAIDGVGNIYVADSSNNRIRKVSPAGLIATVAGNSSRGYSGDGLPATDFALDYPTGVAIDGQGNLYIADAGNYRIRKVSPTGSIATLAGIGKNENFGYGYSGDGGPATSAELNYCCFNLPPIFAGGIALDGNGNVYIADTNNNRIREVLTSPPSLSLAPVNFQFSGSSAGIPSTAQVLTISSSIPYVPFSVSVSTTDGKGWLSVDATAGVAPRAIQVIADPSELAAGSYSGTIKIQSDVASPRTTSIPVLFHVGPGVAPLLAIDQSNLTFPFPKGAGARSQSVRLLNTGGGGFYYHADVLPGASWLSVEPAFGVVTASQAATLAVTANPSGLAAGTYTGRIAISSIAVGWAIVSVTMTISTNASALLLSQAGVSFTAIAGGGVVPPQNFGILTFGNGALNLSADSATVKGGNWLAAATSTASAGPPSVNVTVNPAGLAAGQYYGLVKVRSPGAANSPQVATAVLRVLPAGTDVGAVLTPNELTFNAVAGAESPGSQIVSIYNITATPKAFIASVTDSFVRFSPLTAVVAPDQPTPIVVQPFTNGLAAGVYHSSITLQFDDSRVRTIGLTIVVTAQTAVSSRSLAKRSLDTGNACQATQLLPTLTSLGGGFSLPAGWPVVLQSQVQDDCGTPLENGSVIAEFSNGDPPVALQSLTGGRWDATWQTGRKAAGVTVTIRATSQDRQLRGSKQVLGGFDLSQQQPVIATGGVTDAASNISFRPLTPGNLITINGTLLSDGTATAPAAPYGTSLGDTSVLIAGTLMPLAATGPNQVSAIVPYGIPVNAQQQVLVQRADTYSLPVQVNLAAASPAIFTTDGSQGMIVDAKGKVIGPGNAAKVGDLITVYCTGLGELQQAVAAGSSGPATSATAVPVSLSIGGQAAQIQFSGLAPQLVGIYFVQATMPPGVAAGDQVPVTLTSLGASPAVSPTVTMAVKN